MTTRELELLQGTLDVLVLRALSWGPMHGFGIARWIQRLTEDALQLEEGTLYPALYRMENRGWIKAEWRTTENNRRAKYYRLTAAGKRQLTEEASQAAGSAARSHAARPRSSPRPDIVGPSVTTPRPRRMPAAGGTPIRSPPPAGPRHRGGVPTQ